MSTQPPNQNRGSGTLFRRIARRLASSRLVDNFASREKVRKKRRLSLFGAVPGDLRMPHHPLSSWDRGQKTVRKNTAAILKTSVTCRWFVENLLVGPDHSEPPRLHGRKRSPSETEPLHTPPRWRQWCRRHRSPRQAGRPPAFDVCSRADSPTRRRTDRRSGRPSPDRCWSPSPEENATRSEATDGNGPPGKSQRKKQATPCDRCRGANVATSVMEPAPRSAVEWQPTSRSVPKARGRADDQGLARAPRSRRTWPW